MANKAGLLFSTAPVYVQAQLLASPLSQTIPLLISTRRVGGGTLDCRLLLETPNRGRAAQGRGTSGRVRV